MPEYPFETHWDWENDPRRHALPLRAPIAVRDTTMDPHQLHPGKSAELKRLERPGDPMNPAHGLERDAETLGDRQAPWYERLLAAAGIGVGVTQGKQARGKAYQPGPKAGRAVHPGEIPRRLDPMGFYDELEYQAQLSGRAKGTPEQWRRDLEKAGVKPRNFEASKWGTLDPKKTYTREEIEQHAKDNRLWLQERRYGGKDPEDIGRVEAIGRPEINDEGIHTVRYSARNIGREYEVFNDKEAGNVWVLDAEGNHIPVGGKPNNQDWNDAASAIREHAEAIARKQAAPKPAYPGEQVDGPLNWEGSDKHPLVLDRGNDTNREVVADRGYSRRELELMAEQKRIDKEAGPVDWNKPTTPEFQAAMDKQNILREQLHNESLNRYHEGHFPDARDYQFHLRFGQHQLPPDSPLAKQLGSRLTTGLGEAQATGGQKIRDQGGRDPEKLAALQKRFEIVKQQQLDIMARGEAWLKQHAPDKAGLAKTPKGVDDLLVQQINAVRYPGGGQSAVPMTLEHIAQQYPHLGEANLISDHLRSAEQSKNLAQAELNSALGQVPVSPLSGNESAMNLAMMRAALIQAARNSGGKPTSLAIEGGPLQNERYGKAHEVHSILVVPSTSGNARMLKMFDRDGKPLGSLDVDRLANVKNSNGWGMHQYEGKYLGDVFNKNYALMHQVMNATRADGAIPIEGGITIGDPAGMNTHYGNPRTGEPGTYNNILSKELARILEQNKSERRVPGIDVAERKAIAREPGAAPMQTVPDLHFNTTAGGAQEMGPFHVHPIDERQSSQILKGLPYFNIAGGLAGTALASQVLRQRDDDDLSPFGPAPDIP